MVKASENEFPKVTFAEGAAPSTPTTGLVIAYAKTDGLLYSKDDAGAETLISGGSIPSYQGARVSDPAGADQDIAATTTTAVTFDTEDFDSDGFADLGTNNTRLTIPSGLGGLYLIGGNVLFASSTETYVLIEVRKNGTTAISQTTCEIGGLTPRLNISTVDVAVPTDYYELTVFVENTAQDVNHSATGPKFWIARLGA